MFSISEVPGGLAGFGNLVDDAIRGAKKISKVASNAAISAAQGQKGGIGLQGKVAKAKKSKMQKAADKEKARNASTSGGNGGNTSATSLTADEFIGEENASMSQRAPPSKLGRYVKIGGAVVGSAVLLFGAWKGFKMVQARRRAA